MNNHLLIDTKRARSISRGKINPKAKLLRLPLNFQKNELIINVRNYPFLARKYSKPGNSARNEDSKPIKPPILVGKNIQKSSSVGGLCIGNNIKSGNPDPEKKGVLIRKSPHLVQIHRGPTEDKHMAIKGTNKRKPPLRIPKIAEFSIKNKDIIYELDPQLSAPLTPPAPVSPVAYNPFANQIIVSKIRPKIRSSTEAISPPIIDSREEPGPTIICKDGVLEGHTHTDSILGIKAVAKGVKQSFTVSCPNSPRCLALNLNTPRFEGHPFSPPSTTGRIIDCGSQEVNNIGNIGENSHTLDYMPSTNQGNIYDIVRGRISEIKDEDVEDEIDMVLKGEDREQGINTFHNSKCIFSKQPPNLNAERLRDKAIAETLKIVLETLHAIEGHPMIPMSDVGIKLNDEELFKLTEFFDINRVPIQIVGKAEILFNSNLPECFLIRVIEGTHQLLEGNFVKADGILRDCLGEVKSYYPAKNNLGVCLYLEGELGQAQRQFKSIYNLYSQNIISLYNKTKLDVEMRNYEAAVHQSTDLIHLLTHTQKPQLSMNVSKAYRLRAIAFLRINNYTAAWGDFAHHENWAKIRHTHKKSTRSARSEGQKATRNPKILCSSYKDILEGQRKLVTRDEAFNNKIEKLKEEAGGSKCRGEEIGANTRHLFSFITSKWHDRKEAVSILRSLGKKEIYTRTDIVTKRGNNYKGRPIPIKVEQCFALRPFSASSRNPVLAQSTQSIISHISHSSTKLSRSRSSLIIALSPEIPGTHETPNISRDVLQESPQRRMNTMNISNPDRPQTAISQHEISRVRLQLKEESSTGGDDLLFPSELALTPKSGADTGKGSTGKNTAKSSKLAPPMLKRGDKPPWRISFRYDHAPETPKSTGRGDTPKTPQRSFIGRKMGLTEPGFGKFMHKKSSFRVIEKLEKEDKDKQLAFDKEKRKEINRIRSLLENQYIEKDLNIIQDNRDNLEAVDKQQKFKDNKREISECMNRIKEDYGDSMQKLAVMKANHKLPLEEQIINNYIQKRKWTTKHDTTSNQNSLSMEEIFVIKSQLSLPIEKRQKGTLIKITRNLKFFMCFPEKICESMLNASKLIIAEADEIIFKEGDIGDNLFVIVKGSVGIRLIRKKLGKDPILTKTLFDGDHFGNLDIFWDNKTEDIAPIRHQTCTSYEKSYIIEIDKNKMTNIEIPEIKEDSSGVLSSLQITSLFSSINKLGLISLVYNLHPITFKMGQTILNEGETPNGLCIIMKGQCILTLNKMLTRNVHHDLLPRDTHASSPDNVYKIPTDDFNAMGAKYVPLTNQSNDIVIFKKNLTFGTLVQFDYFGARAILPDKYLKEIEEVRDHTEEGLEKQRHSTLTIVANSESTQVILIERRHLNFLSPNIQKVLFKRILQEPEIDRPYEANYFHNIIDKVYSWEKYKEETTTKILKEFAFEKNRKKNFVGTNK